MDEPVWSKAAKLPLAYETFPGENIDAPVKTDVYIFNTSSHLYFALICHDPDPKSIRAHYSERDQIDNDDVININLDTFNDERRNYFLGVNPLGLQRDGVESDNGMSDWDGLWSSAGRITDKGYIIEIAIPFSSLQFQRKKGPQVWGLDISRWYPRAFLHRLGLVKLDRNKNSYQQQFLKISGFEGVKPGKNIEVIPTLTGVKTDSRTPFPDGEFQSEKEKLDPGITVSWGLTPNLTLNGTVNPDFSQVEADARQLDLNQPFALFFPEKRPFFTEGADFFKSLMQVIHTRTMRDPVWGLKLSGKEGNNTIGAYYVRDNVTNLIFPGFEGSSQTSLDMESSATVLRYVRDFGSNYTLGGIITNREGGDYFNRVFGIDGSARFDSKNQLEFQVLGSRTRYPTAVAREFGQKEETFGGKAIQANYKYSSRNIIARAGYYEFDSDFRTDLGFVPLAGYRSYETVLNYRWQKTGSWWNQITIGVEHEYAWNHDGDFLADEQEIFFNFNGIMQSQIHLEAEQSRQLYQGVIYRIYTGRSHFSFRPSSGMRFYLNSNFGRQVDYINSRAGRRVQLNGGTNYNFGQHLILNFDHTYEDMNSGGKALYTANISQGSLIYYFNSRMFLRSILQYVDYKYNPDNYIIDIDPEYKELFAQFLFSYRLNPRTVAFLGYTTDYNGGLGLPLTGANRTIFMKISYSWQL